MTKKALRFDAGDNVAVALEAMSAGDRVLINGEDAGDRDKGGPAPGAQAGPAAHCPGRDGFQIRPPHRHGCLRHRGWQLCAHAQYKRPHLQLEGKLSV